MFLLTKFIAKLKRKNSLVVVAHQYERPGGYAIDL